MVILSRPTPKDYPAYYQQYIQKVPEGDLLQYLKTTDISELEALEEESWSFAYAEGKWTIKELWLHITDTERIMAYRALRIALSAPRSANRTLWTVLCAPRAAH